MGFAVVFVLSVLVHLSTAALPVQKFWFSTKVPITEYSEIDFRGCYGPECVYVAATAVADYPSKRIGVHGVADLALWAVGKKTPTGESVQFVFSQVRPKDEANTLWATPVADRRIIPAVFNASAYQQDEPDPHVQEFVNSLDGDRIRAIVEHLASYNSRNSLSPDTPRAGDWIADFMADNGCQNIQKLTFRNGWAPNVLCEFPGTDPNALPIVVGGHYDSRSTNVNSPTQRAPGADDNGSGSAAVMEILATAHELIENEGFSFEAKIIFVVFAGEEQGLVGSAALATSYSNQGVDLTAMVNLDMIAYPDRTNPQTLYWMSGSTTSALTDLAFELTKLYMGENTLVARTGACCSDQQSFYSRGYPAASIFESRTASNNPNYHQSSDLPSTLNYQHLLRNCQSAAALITTLAKLTGPL